MRIPIHVKRRACELACVVVYKASPTKSFGDIEVLYKYEMGFNFIVFRGSDEGSDWKRNFSFWPKKVKGLGKFHRGYWTQIDRYHEKIYNLIPPSRRQEPLIVCGHSKGGAESQLFALKRFARKSNIACLMFASPKPIRKMYSHSYEGILRQSTTIYVNPHDGVTKMPPFWKYIGKEVHRKLRLVGKFEHPGINYLDLFDEFTEEA